MDSINESNDIAISEILNEIKDEAQFVIKIMEVDINFFNGVLCDEGLCEELLKESDSDVQKLLKHFKINNTNDLKSFITDLEMLKVQTEELEKFGLVRSQEYLLQNKVYKFYLDLSEKLLSSNKSKKTYDEILLDYRTTKNELLEKLKTKVRDNKKSIFDGNDKEAEDQVQFIIKIIEVDINFFSEVTEVVNGELAQKLSQKREIDEFTRLGINDTKGLKLHKANLVILILRLQLAMLNAYIDDAKPDNLESLMKQIDKYKECEELCKHYSDLSKQFLSSYKKYDEILLNYKKTRNELLEELKLKARDNKIDDVKENELKDKARSIMEILDIDIAFYDQINKKRLHKEFLQETARMDIFYFGINNAEDLELYIANLKTLKLVIRLTLNNTKVNKRKPNTLEELVELEMEQIGESTLCKKLFKYYCSLLEHFLSLASFGVQYNTIYENNKKELLGKLELKKDTLAISKDENKISNTIQINTESDKSKENSYKSEPNGKPKPKKIKSEPNDKPKPKKIKKVIKKIIKKKNTKETVKDTTENRRNTITGDNINHEIVERNEEDHKALRKIESSCDFLRNASNIEGEFNKKCDKKKVVGEVTKKLEKAKTKGDTTRKNDIFKEQTKEEKMKKDMVDTCNFIIENKSIIIRKYDNENAVISRLRGELGNTRNKKQPSEEKLSDLDTNYAFDLYLYNLVMIVNTRDGKKAFEKMLDEQGSAEAVNYLDAFLESYMDAVGLSDKQKKLFRKQKAGECGIYGGSYDIAFESPIYHLLVDNFKTDEKDLKLFGDLDNFIKASSKKELISCDDLLDHFRLGLVRLSRIATENLRGFDGFRGYISDYARNEFFESKNIIFGVSFGANYELDNNTTANKKLVEFQCEIERLHDNIDGKIKTHKLYPRLSLGNNKSEYNLFNVVNYAVGCFNKKTNINEKNEYEYQK